jgi:FkbM family methyltransferase
MARLHRGTVLAFEPFPANFASLARNLELNYVTNVRAIAKACSDQPGRAAMELEGESNPGMARLSATGSTNVELALLDDEVDHAGGAVAVIKMDVEGHEGAVLRGARRTLERDRPVIVTEVLPDAHDEIITTLTEMGYSGEPFFRSDWVFLPN